MKLRRFLLRYYPPGIILEYQHRSGETNSRCIDLFDLSPADSADIESLASAVITAESHLSEKHKPVLMKLILRLLDKQKPAGECRFELVRAQQTHFLPMTNVAWSKDGSQFVTGSYDQTCRVWNTWDVGTCLTLEGVHDNVVYAVTVNANNPQCVMTGSFDGSAVLWDASTGVPLSRLTDHAGEIVCVAFSPNGKLCASGSMDFTAAIWDVESGEKVSHLKGHAGEIISLTFSSDSSRILTGSFDTTSRVWDVSSGSCIAPLIGHEGEISSAVFSFSGDFCVTGSIDSSARLWESTTGRCIDILEGHSDEVLDVQFNLVGSRIVTASADTTARIFNAKTGACVAILTGHQGEVSKSVFSPNGTYVLTASTDRTCRIWSPFGECLQILEGHTQEVFCCGFNYEADLIFTASKDNTVRVYQARSSSVKSTSRPRALSSLDSVVSVGFSGGLEDAAYRLRASDEFT